MNEIGVVNYQNCKTIIDQSLHDEENEHMKRLELELPGLLLR